MKTNHTSKLNIKHTHTDHTHNIWNVRPSEWQSFGLTQHLCVYSRSMMWPSDKDASLRYCIQQKCTTTFGCTFSVFRVFRSFFGQWWCLTAWLFWFCHWNKFIGSQKEGKIITKIRVGFFFYYYFYHFVAVIAIPSQLRSTLRPEPKSSVLLL